MKKKIYLGIAAAALALAACNNDNETTGNTANEIRVDASIGQMTRVTTDGNESAFETGDRISVYSWLGTADEVQQLVVNNSVNTLGDDGTWTASPQMLWANNSSAHYFLGVYPVQEVSDLKAMNYVLTPEDQEASDLLYALNTGTENKGITPTGTPVALTFSHLMSRLVINLNFRSQWGGTPVIESVKAVAKTEASVNFLSGEVSAQGDNKAIDIPALATPAANYACSFAGIMVPQQSGFYEIQIKVKGIDQPYIYNTGAPIPLETGKYTTINLTLGRDGITLDKDITITDWTPLEGDFNGNIFFPGV